MKHNLHVLWTMASYVAKDLFYEKLEAMKSSKKGNSKLTVYIDDEFYQNAKNWLKNENTTHEEFGLTKLDVATIKRKQWTIFNDNILSRDQKNVVPRKDIYSVLCQAHCAIAHRGRDKTEDFVKKSHAEISQHVITLFVSLCSLHQQQKSVTDHLRTPISRPIQANDFLSHVQFDLMEFRNLTCSCGKITNGFCTLLIITASFHGYSLCNLKPVSRFYNQSHNFFGRLALPKSFTQTMAKNLRMRT